MQNQREVAQIPLMFKSHKTFIQNVGLKIFKCCNNKINNKDMIGKENRDKI